MEFHIFRTRRRDFRVQSPHKDGDTGAGVCSWMVEPTLRQTQPSLSLLERLSRFLEWFLFVSEPGMKTFHRTKSREGGLGNSNRIKIFRKEEKCETVKSSLLLHSSTPPPPRSHSSSSLTLLPTHLTPQPSVEECVCVSKCLLHLLPSAILAAHTHTHTHIGFTLRISLRTMKVNLVAEHLHLLEDRFLMIIHPQHQTHVPLKQRTSDRSNEAPQGSGPGSLLFSYYLSSRSPPGG